ncbi:MAG TPA: hypothetical protein VD837_06960 [Terriglobales bacterium]|nr:hypothetical protein [Terriglobales bacterium]
MGRLHTGEDESTHVVHVIRRELMNVTLSEVTRIQQEGTSKTYRVKRVVDDPNLATVAFHCTLA